MKLTEQDIEDLEVVVDLATSSEYMDSTNDKACYRVEELIKKLKLTAATATKNSVMKGTVTTEDGSVTLLREEIDCYRGRLDCTIYMKDSSIVYTTMSFEEVDAIFDL